MNAASLEELRNSEAITSSPNPPENPATAAAYAADEKMEQIRKLLIGDKLAENADRLATLEKRQSAFEHTVLQRLDLLSQRLDALSRDVHADRRAAFDELSRAMLDLGNRVRGI